MEKIKKSGVLKIISYILIPFLVLQIVFSLISLQYAYDNMQDIEKQDYYQTEQFINNQYITALEKVFKTCKKLENKTISNDEKEDKLISEYISDQAELEYTLIQKETQKIYYEPGYYEYSQDYFDYVIIDKITGTIYTNINSNDYNQEIQKINESNYNWKIENGKLSTKIENLQELKIKYLYGLDNIENLKSGNYNIYFNFNEAEVPESSQLYMQKFFYDLVLNVKDMQLFLCIISITLLTIITIYLFWSIGYSNKSEEIDLNQFDKFYYEIVFIIFLIVMGLGINIFGSMTYSSYSLYPIVAFVAIYFLLYIACAIIGITTIKRIKSKTFIKSLLIYKIVKWLTREIKVCTKTLLWNKTTTLKLTILYFLFLLITIVLIATMGSGISIILLAIFWGLTLYWMIKYTKQLDYVQQVLKNAYEGNKDAKLESIDLEQNLQQMIVHIEKISTGFTKAIEESLKSERMKTELITNVSHDIKTPLTSIINYVDLLKKEKIPNEKAQEYLSILDQKSQRLKRLTEDLVEASKASSGNIKLDMKNINVKELINQISGEFQDKFKQKNLELIITMPTENVNIMADSRYLYRVIENMYTNIIKYALETSRVYVDIVEKKDKVEIQLKNISKEKLNISADELMQRFVRGETSRNTEGSGLGLSIAQSLTQLQNGKFNIYLDGDLFKVTIEFKKI